MATSFPSGLDSLTNPSSGDSLSSPSHSAQHANVNDAVEALQAKVGVNGSAVTSSHDYQLANIGTWTAFTPTWTNLTVGNATQNWKYCLLNDLLAITGFIVLGSTSSVGTNPYFTFPTGPSDTTAYGTAVFSDAGSAERQGMCYCPNGLSRVQLGAYIVSGSVINRSNVSATFPHTWTTNDAIGASLVVSLA